MYQIEFYLVATLFSQQFCISHVDIIRNIEEKLATKPQLRGLLTDQIKKHLGISIALSVAATLAYKFAVADVRKQVYAEFYRYNHF